MRLCRWISAVFCGKWTPCIHEWFRMSSKDGLSEGLKAKHHLMRCWHSGERKYKQAVSRWPLFTSVCKLSKPPCLPLLWDLPSYFMGQNTQAWFELLLSTC